MKEFLTEGFKEGGLDLSDYPLTHEYSPSSPPSEELLNIAQDNHNQGSFNPTGNKWDMNFEELTRTIKWISVQEDLNYPPEKGNQGRLMCLKRYIEAIECINSDNYSLGEVIDRATIKNEPPPDDWDDIEYPNIF